MSLSEATQLKRLNGLGGSELSAVCGLNPFMSAGDVWMSKMGLRDSVETFHTIRGECLEGGLRKWYGKVTGRKVITSDPIQHPQISLLWATPDGLVFDSKKDAKPRRTLELKSPGMWDPDDWGEPGTDQVPNYYVPQLMAEASCAGLPLADAGAMIKGDLKPYTVPYNGALFETIAAIALQWWDAYVVTKTPPPPEATEAYAKFLSKRFPVSIGTILVANAEMEDAAETLRKANAALEKAEKDQLHAKNAMKLLIGENDGVQGTFGKITWKNNRSSAYVDWEGLATSLGPTPQQIAEFIKTKPGARPFNVPRSWKKEDSSGQANQADTGTANNDTEPGAGSGDGEASA